MVGFKYRPCARTRNSPNIRFAPINPCFRRLPVGEIRIEIVALHRAHRLFAAEEMACFKHRPANRVELQRVIGNFDPAHDPVDMRQHLVVEHEGFERCTQKRGGHARAFINHVAAGKRGDGRGDALFRSHLSVDRFCIAHR